MRCFERLEGELAFVDRLLEDDACDRARMCPTRMVLSKVYEGVNRIVRITLQDMLNDYGRVSAKEDSI